MARETKRALAEAGREGDFGPWRSCKRAFRPVTDGYLRFVVEQSNGQRVGLFRADDAFDELAELPRAARSQLRSTLRWFNANLDAPRRLPRQAVCWFRADARDAIERVRTLVELYRMARIDVWMQATRTPGRIVYRDEHQIAAVPYRDRRATSSVV